MHQEKDDILKSHSQLHEILLWEKGEMDQNVLSTY